MPSIIEGPILIIDFMNYVHRCRVGDLTGEYVLVFNFFRNLRSTVEQFKPSKLFFALEGYPKYRYDLFAGYKSNRIIKTASKKSTSEHVIDSANLIQELLLLLSTTLVHHPDFEADDIINSLCYNMSEEYIVICSSDSDCIQILQHGHKNCNLYNPIKKEFIVPPIEPYVALKSLLGDKSDSIPRLLSEKKAMALIGNPILFKKFLDIEENRADFNINRQLIEFKKIPEDELIVKEGFNSFDDLRLEFSKMEFISIVNDNSWARFKKTFESLIF